MDGWSEESPQELTLQGVFAAQFGAPALSVGAMEGF